MKFSINIIATENNSDYTENTVIDPLVVNPESCLKD